MPRVQTEKPGESSLQIRRPERNERLEEHKDMDVVPREVREESETDKGKNKNA